MSRRTGCFSSPSQLGSCTEGNHNCFTSQSVYTNCCLYRGWEDYSRMPLSERCLNPAPSLQIRRFIFFFLEDFTQYHLFPQACKHIYTLISPETLLRTPQKYNPRVISKALLRPYMHMCILSWGIVVEPVLTLEYLPLHCTLASSSL